jgi:hypothetical protein
VVGVVPFPFSSYFLLLLFLPGFFLLFLPFLAELPFAMGESAFYPSVTNALCPELAQFGLILLPFSTCQRLLTIRVVWVLRIPCLP